MDSFISVNGTIAQFLLDTKQLIVLRHTVGTAQRTGLDLAAVRSDRDISDRSVLGLSGAVRGHGRVSMTVCHLDGVQRLGQGTDLVDLDQDRVGATLLDSLRQELHIGHELIITY